ncbi:MAG: ankyrin repeat domain-containing protein, partial [Gammaproteobacteria bacterium]|nr:ankyrin repeat domain-containing protein [Gammaproteobacteria bacterium]
NTITPELNLFPQLDRPPIVAIQSLYDIPCTQTVLCQWLVTFPLKLSENQKNNLALLCAKQGYAKALSILLSQGVNPNYADLQEEKTLLLMAIANNHAPTVEVLLNAGATMERRS